MNALIKHNKLFWLTNNDSNNSHNNNNDNTKKDWTMVAVPMLIANRIFYWYSVCHWCTHLVAKQKRVCRLFDKSEKTQQLSRSVNSQKTFARKHIALDTIA